MELQNLLNVIKPDEELNIYDVINNVYLHQDILKEDCSDVYNSYKVITVMTRVSHFGHSMIEIDVANKNDLFIG